MVRQAGEIGGAVRRLGERGERRLVQLEPPLGRNRVLDREAGELVAEDRSGPFRAEHAGRETLVEPFHLITGDRAEEPELRLRRDDRHRLEHRATRRRETGCTGEDGVPHRLGNRVDSGGESLDDEERVSAGLVVELVRVGTVRLGELCDRRRGEPGQPQAADRAARGQLAEDDPQRICELEPVVAVTGDRECGDPLDPADEQAKDVERGLVRPVDVLEHEHARGTSVQLLGQRGDHLVRPRAALDERAELAPDRLRDVEQRAERPGREQRIAGAEEDLGRAGPVVAEAADQGGLSDPGLAANQGDVAATAPLHRFDAVGEDGQLAVPFEQPACGAGLEPDL